MITDAALLRDPHAAAHAAGLRYVSLEKMEDAGIWREKAGRKFSYRSAQGRAVRDRDTLARIAHLAIPPAWTRVWICALENGHIQCTGIDARGRKQYRYHEKWRLVRDSAKYEDVLRFGHALPKLRALVAQDLSRGHQDLSQLGKGTVIAAVLRIMDRTHVRVGNDRYTRANHSFGLTTLLTRHAVVRKTRITLDFVGKGGKRRHATFEDDKLAQILLACRALRGARLFRYHDDAGRLHPITSKDVNDYIHRATGEPFTAKEFRTWAATVGAALRLYGADPCESAAHGKRTVRAQIEEVANELGNTHTICRKSYVHPAVLRSYLDGALHREMKKCLAKAREQRRAWFHVDECAVLALLKSAA